MLTNGDNMEYLIGAILEGLAEAVFEFIGGIFIDGMVKCFSSRSRKSKARRGATTLVLTRSRDRNRPEH
jgi:hypothetical protein